MGAVEADFSVHNSAPIYIIGYNWLVRLCTEASMRHGPQAVRILLGAFLCTRYVSEMGRALEYDTESRPPKHSALEINDC